TPEVAMSYVAYFKQGADPAKRPITFLYNGGPGSSTVWLLMGAYGPERVVTKDHTHTPAAPYQLVNNDYSLLDASDLVFIDMPGTRFGRLLPQGKTEAERAKSRAELAKQIWSVDGDAQAFSRFIMQFLSKYNRWNSPKYLYGESYGTTRSAVLADDLEQEDNIDLNGVIMQSQILNFGLAIDGPSPSLGAVLPYVLALPTYAANAWYHHKLPKYDDGKLGPLLKQVIQFARTDYQQALFAGASLDAPKKEAVAQTLQAFTGVPASYWLKADLLVDADMFQHELLGSTDATVSQLDTRFVGPSMDPMGERAVYAPQSAAISSAYISAFNEYVRDTLKFGQGMHYRAVIHDVKDFHWDMKHRGPGRRFGNGAGLNVMGDLAAAMKYNPDLKVMWNGAFSISRPRSTPRSMKTRTCRFRSGSRRTSPTRSIRPAT
ncbi:MAG: S10 family peptidase, partial [Rhodanobacteraceae bacterium]